MRGGEVLRFGTGRVVSVLPVRLGPATQATGQHQPSVAGLERLVHGGSRLAGKDVGKGMRHGHG